MVNTVHSHLLFFVQFSLTVTAGSVLEDLESILTNPGNHDASVAPSGIFKAREGYIAIVN